MLKDELRESSADRFRYYQQGYGHGWAGGVAAVYTPKDFDLTAIMADIVEIVDRGTREAA